MQLHNIIAFLGNVIACFAAHFNADGHIRHSRAAGVPLPLLIILALLTVSPDFALAGRGDIDFERYSNYFYDRYYPNSESEFARIYDEAVRSFEKKDLRKALFYLNNVLKYDMFCREALNLYGVVLLIENKHSDAKEFFRRAVFGDRKYKNPYMNLGLLAIKTESWRDLEAVATDYLNVDAGDFDACLGLGMAAFHLFNYADSEASLDRAWALRDKCEREEFLDALREYRSRVKAKNRRLY